MNTRISTPLPLLYFKDGKRIILPYLCLEVGYKMWGIQAGQLFFRRQCENSGNWYYAQRVSAHYSVNGEQALLPSRSHMESVCQCMAKFDETVEILNSHDVQAEKWKDRYWTSETAEPGLGYGFNIKDGGEFVAAKLDSCARIRLALLCE